MSHLRWIVSLCARLILLNTEFTHCISHGERAPSGPEFLILSARRGAIPVHVGL